jgi:hypothetical protein
LTLFKKIPFAIKRAIRDPLTVQVFASAGNAQLREVISACEKCVDLHSAIREAAKLFANFVAGEEI